MAIGLSVSRLIVPCARTARVIGRQTYNNFPPKNQRPKIPNPRVCTMSSASTPKQREPKKNQKPARETEMEKNKESQYWLLKTEAGEWSWEDQAANGGVSQWDGVKNRQAQKYMKSMKLGDLCFFYHSGAKARRVVGVVSVIKEWYSSSDQDGAVDVRAEGEMRKPVDLKEMKGDDGIKGFVLFRQPRLSVVPVSKKIWDRICEIGGGYDDGSEADE